MNKASIFPDGAPSVLTTADHLAFAAEEVIHAAYGEDCGFAAACEVAAGIFDLFDRFDRDAAACALAAELLPILRHDLFKRER